MIFLFFSEIDPDEMLSRNFSCRQKPGFELLNCEKNE